MRRLVCLVFLACLVAGFGCDNKKAVMPTQTLEGVKGSLPEAPKTPPVK